MREPKEEKNITNDSFSVLKWTLIYQHRAIVSDLNFSFLTLFSRNMILLFMNENENRKFHESKLKFKLVGKFHDSCEWDQISDVELSGIVKKSVRVYKKRRTLLEFVYSISSTLWSFFCIIIAHSDTIVVDIQFNNKLLYQKCRLNIAQIALDTYSWIKYVRERCHSWSVMWYCK